MSEDEDLHLLLERAFALGKAGRDAESEALLQTAVDRFPDDAEARLRLGSTIGDERPTEAVGHYRAAASLAPHDPLKLTRCATHMYSLGEFEDARDYVVRVHSLVADPREFEYLPQLFHVFGRLAERGGATAEAEEALSLAFELDPEMYGHAEVLAAFLADRERFTEALEILSKGLEHRPGDEPLMRMRADIIAFRAELEGWERVYGGNEGAP